MSDVPQRRFSGQRELRVVVRTVHIASAAMVLGPGALSANVDSWARALFLSGLLLIADELFRYGLHWFRWTHAWVVLGKVGLVGVGALHPDLAASMGWAALILGALISHASGSIRQRAVWGPPGPCALRTKVEARCGTS
jgi:hypothetical protein